MIRCIIFRVFQHTSGISEILGKFRNFRKILEIKIFEVSIDLEIIKTFKNVRKFWKVLKYFLKC